MNFIKRVNGSWVDTPNYIHKTDTDTFTTLPAVLYPNAATATVGLKGNTTQSGTPTPDSPVMPQGTGERTGNLAYSRIDGVNVGSNGTIVRTDAYDVAIGSVESGKVYTINSYVLAFYTDEPTIGSMSYDGSRIVATPGTPTTFTAPITGYVAFRVESGEQAMLNSDSTALPYEPYGIKIPILSVGQTTTIYLGEVESTRRIKKLVLTGEEDNWTKAASANVYANTSITSDCYNPSGIITCMCSHYAAQGNVSGVRLVNDSRCCFRTTTTTLYIGDNTHTDLESFLTYLQQQYTNGTPVTIWYVLAKEITGIVNEPIMKIGNYADSISGISITTTAGANTLDVDTTVKPSEVTASFNGWHPVADVHEKSKNLFDKDRTNDIIDDSYINISGGISTNSRYYISYPIYLTVGETYTWRFDNVQVHSAPTIGFYDNSNNLMGVATHDASITNFSFTVPSGCAYVRCSVYKNLQSEAMLNLGSEALPYEPYWT